jgi:4-oxalocrotonate tautomerase
MPLVRIDLPKGISPAEKNAISEGVHRALVESINVPEQDKFQVISERDAHDLIVAESYLDIPHTGHTALVQIFLNEGRSTELKKALYHRVAEKISQVSSIKAADVIINLVEVKRENWSFGNGIAQYAS